MLTNKQTKSQALLHDLVPFIREAELRIYSPFCKGLSRLESTPAFIALLLFRQW